MDNRMRRGWSVLVAIGILGGAAWLVSLAGAPGPLAAGPEPSAVVVEGRVIDSILPATLDPAEEVGDRREGPVSARRDPSALILGSADAVLQQTPSVIEEQGFEGETFPPEGWEVVDRVSQTTGPAIVNGFSRQICQRPQTGGDAAAWSVGGGSQGSSLACEAAFTQPQGNVLRFRDIDASNAPFGLRIDLSVWVDWRLQETQADTGNGFFVCVFPSPTENGSCRYYVDTSANPIQKKRWLPSAPLLFPAAAGKPDAELWFLFTDTAPDGTHSGVFIDNVVISGQTEAPTSTPTSTNPTATPTSTRTATAGPSPTLAPSPTRPASTILLPMAMKHADKDDPSMFPTPPSASATVEFGTDVLGDGTVVGKATRFQYGIMQLCSKMSWFGYPAGAQMRWQWYIWNGTGFTEIAGTLNGTIDAGEADWVERCAVSQQNGAPVPIPPTRFKVSVFAGTATEPLASEIAEVVDAPLPGEPTFTPTWTPQPTIPPSATPVATPGQGGCRQPFENGDFERGPSVGWTLQTNANLTDITRVIRRAEDVSPGFVAAGGEWLALLGGGVNVRDLIFTPLWELPEASRVISATLDFSFGIITEEQKNGNHDDPMTLWLVNQDNQRIQIPGSGVTEEIIDPNQWYQLNDPIDISQLVTQREGWSQARFLVESNNSAAARSIHLLDEIKLEICVSASDPAPSRKDRRPDTGTGDTDSPASPWVRPENLVPSGQPLRAPILRYGAGISTEPVRLERSSR